MQQLSDAAAAVRNVARTRAWRAPPTRPGPGLAAVVGGALAAAAVGNWMAARRAERAHPPRGRFIEVEGVRLHYLDTGPSAARGGPVVVLIHGNGVSSEDWVLSGLFDRLALTHRVVAIDRPGFGYSDRPRGRPWTAADQARVLLAGLNDLGVDAPAVVVGHSWGTLVALEAALAEPQRVRALVLMSGYYWPTPRPDVLLGGGPAIPGLGDLMRHTVSPLLGRAISPLAFKHIFSPAKVAPHFAEGFSVGMAMRPSQIRAVAADTAMMPREAAKTAERHLDLTAPVLVITGDGDKIVSCDHQSRRLARELLGGQIQVVPGAGHMVHHTAPDAVASGIEAFVGEIGIGPGSLVEGGARVAATTL